MGIKSALVSRSIVAVTACLAAGSALSQIQIELPPPLSIVGENNKEIYKLNWYCNEDNPADCLPLEQRINKKNVKSPQDVAVGLVNDQNFALVGSSLGKKAKTLLFVEPEPGASGYWDMYTFDGAQADAIAVTRQDKTVYVASNKNSDGAIRAYALTCGSGVPVTDDCWGAASFVTNVEVDGQACTDVVDLVEYPRRSGNLVATCASPAGAATINFNSGAPVVTEIVGPADLLILPAGLFTRVPTGGDVAATEFGTFLLLSTNDQDSSTPNEAVVAFKLNRTTGDWVRQAGTVVEYAGNLGGIAAGLCVDAVNPVDGSPCAVISQAGDGGQSRLVELVDVGGGTIGTTPLLTAGQNFNNPKGGTSFANQGSVKLDDCAPNCQVATQVLNTDGAMNPQGSAEFSTEGVFPDPRFVSPGVCVTPAVPLLLDFTEIPGLEDVKIDPQHCARDNGFFYIDVIDDGPGSAFTEGFVEWFSDDSDVCYQAGDASIPDIEDVDYGQWAGDPDDALAGGEDEFAEDRLIGCFNPKRRGGESLSFIIEGFQGHQDFNVGDPEPLLYPYGDRELHESLDIIDVNSDCDPFAYSGACLEHIAALNKALVGWNLQDDLENNATVVMKDAFAGGAPSETALAVLDGRFGTTLDLTATASNGNLTFKSVNDGTQTWTAMSVNGGEIELGETLSFDVTSTPRGIDVDVPFRVNSFTVAFLFDGPEFNDVEEEMQVTATLANGDLLVGVLKAEFTAGGMEPTWTLNGSSSVETVLSPATNPNGAGVSRVDDPFDGELVTALEFTPLEVTGPCENGGNCTNQSDGSVYDLEIEVFDRVEALEFAYEGLMESLCPVSTRDLATAPSTPRRPAECEISGFDSGPSVSDFNTLSPQRNIAGRQQVSGESLGRFVGHNICLLVEDNPGLYSTADPLFCDTPPSWDFDPTP